MNTTVAYKKASDLKSKDMVILPDLSVKQVAGKIIRKEFTFVTFVGGIERQYLNTDLMKILASSSNTILPKYVNYPAHKRRGL